MQQELNALFNTEILDVHFLGLVVLKKDTLVRHQYLIFQWIFWKLSVHLGSQDGLLIIWIVCV